jgi:FlaA1/EpsC-like NDP-sugar epimerase
MLIPEAVQLVLHAACFDESGAVYVLEMGEPIKLVEMARNLIRLCGYTPDEDIAIEFIGLRPGEKLHEELVGPGETSLPSSVEKILKVAQSAQSREAAFETDLKRLETLAAAGNRFAALALLSRILPSLATATGRAELPIDRRDVDNAVSPFRLVRSRVAE